MTEEKNTEMQTMTYKGRKVLYDECHITMYDDRGDWEGYASSIKPIYKTKRDVQRACREILKNMEGPEKKE